MARRSKDELVKCEYCGEMYSTTYRHCPFCNEDGTGSWNDPATFEDDPYDEAPRGGGKRLQGGFGRGGGPSVGQIIGWVVSLALIIAAAGIVISIVKPLLHLGGGKEDVQAAASASPGTVSQQPSADPAVGEPSQAPVDPTGEQQPVPSDAQPVTSAAPAGLGTVPSDFSLSKEDFTFYNKGEVYQVKLTYIPADARGDVTWRSSDPNVAAVSWNGVVTAVAPGTATITASVEGVGEKSCIARCSFENSSSPNTTTTTTTTTVSGEQTAPPAASVSLSREDFTLSHAGETWRLVVSGTSSAVTWASSDEAVATVGADGTVTAVGSGTCRVTASVDGVTLKCIVRCSF